MYDIRILNVSVFSLAALMSIVCSASASSHDVAWTFDNAGTQSYVLESFGPNAIDFGLIGAEDPNLTLHLGLRYQVSIVRPTLHPFQVLAKGSTAASDTILLSMGNTVGPFETDPNVDWEDNGLGTVTFTLTPGLYQAMTVPDKIPGYRCGIHVSNMRGNFYICTTPIRGDLDANCWIDFFDLGIFVGQWLDPPGSCSGLTCADLDGVDGVDMFDYAILAFDWLECNLDPAGACWQ
ncbi:MAG: hypothetical protein ACYSUC_08455 [Planctomycetota bacterium]|jgi:hypothetical protein